MAQKHNDQYYHARWLRIVNVMLKSNLSISRIAPAGSRARREHNLESDIDIIFYTSPEQDHQIIRKYLLEKAKSAFGNVENFKLGNKVVHIDFKSPKCNFDLVYVTQKKFQEEIKKIKIILKLSQVKKNAIKIVKYALDKSRIKNIAGYEVEKACVFVNSTSLPDCVKKILKYFRGRIEENYLTIESILKKIT